jgi:hypothetical protein
MEKIKDGKYANIQEEWTQEVECKKFDGHDSEGCGAAYIVDPTDLVLRYFKGTHSYNYYTAMQCEQCDKYTRVFDVPKMVLKAIYTAENKKKATFDGFGENDW